MLRFLTSRLFASVNLRVFANAGWASAALPIQTGLGIVQTGMMARMLGPEGLGTVALLGAVCGFFGSVLKITSAEPVSVYVSKAEAEGDYLLASYVIRYFYHVDFLTSLVAFSAVSISALVVPRLLNLSPGTEWLQAIFGLTVIFQSTYWTSQSLLRVADRFSWTFYHSVAHSTIKTVGVALLFIAEKRLEEIVILLVGLSFLDGLSLYLMARMALGRKGLCKAKQPGPWWKVAKEIRAFQLAGYGRESLKAMSRHLDMLLVGYLASPIQAGFYRAGKQITDYVQLPTQGFVASLFPEYSRLYFSGNVQQLRRLVLYSLGIFASCAILAGVALWLGAEWIIVTVLGENFVPANKIVQTLMISVVVLFSMSPVYSLPAAVGRAGPAFRSVLAATTVQIIVILWLVPVKGALGAAWANVGYVVIWAMVLTPSILRVLRVKEKDRSE